LDFADYERRLALLQECFNSSSKRTSELRSGRSSCSNDGMTHQLLLKATGHTLFRSIAVRSPRSVSEASAWVEDIGFLFLRL
jgi:hypothetical protein